MEKKVRLLRRLHRLNTQFVDQTANSPQYFNITSMPSIFTVGKNVFKIKGNKSYFVENTRILIEVMDSNGDSIYHEVLSEKDDDRSLTVIVYVYKDTPPGAAIITFIGTAAVDLTGKLISKDNIVENNIKYTHKIDVNQTKRNDSEVIYTEKPVVTISEKKYSVAEEKFLGITNYSGASGSKVRYARGTGSYSYNFGKPKITTTNASFLEEFQNGTIVFKTIGSNYAPIPSWESQPLEYRATITEVLTPNQMQVSESAYVYGLLDQQQLVTTITNVPYEVTFSYDATSRNITQNRKVYAELDIDKLDPAGGSVNRIKVFYKSSNKPESSYEIAYDSEVKSQNLLVDTQNDLVSFPLGSFTKNKTLTKAGISQTSSINPENYWQTTIVGQVASASLVESTASLFGGISSIPSNVLSGSSEMFFEQKNSVRTNYLGSREYSVIFDYFIQKNLYDTRQPKLSVYLSGSAFVNTDSYGKLIANVETSQSLGINHKVLFTTDADGWGVLKFSLRDGVSLANIRVEEALENGYTPQKTKLYVPIKQEHRNEYLDFKVQFFNYTLQEANEHTEVFSTFFEGGNVYIYGDDNISTGSMYVSPYTSSGIHVYSNISGSRSGSSINSFGYRGRRRPQAFPGTASDYGWAVTVNDPFFTGTDSGKSVQMINEENSLFDFRSTPPSFNFTMRGTGSKIELATPLQLTNTLDPGNSTSATSSFLFVSSSNNVDGYDLYFRQKGNLVKWKWLESQLSTGILFGDNVNFTGSTFYVGSGSGIIVNHNATQNAEIHPEVTYVSWPSVTQSISGINTRQSTYIYVDSNGTIQQRSSPFTPELYKTAIPLGRLSHYDYANINAWSTNVDTAYDMNTQQNDFIRAFGPLKISGLNIIPTSSLSFSIEAGTSYNLGGFYSQSPSNPSLYTSSAATTTSSSIVRIYRSGSGFRFDNNNGAYYTSVDPANYDTGTGTGSVANNRWTIQHVFYNPITQRPHIYYGQAVYLDKASALASVATEEFSESEITAKSYTFLGYLVLKGDTTNLSSTDNAIVQGGLFRSTVGGGGAGGGGGAIDGTSGTSGTSGTGININNPLNGGVLLSDGTSNAATASSNLTFTSNRFVVTGSVVISGSTSTGLFIDGLTTSTGNTNRLTYAPATSRVQYETVKFVSTSSIGDGVTTAFAITHNLNATYVNVNIQDGTTGRIWYPTVDTGSNPMSGMYQVNTIDANRVLLNFNSSFPPTTAQYRVIVTK